LTGLGDLAGLGPARSETIEYLHARTLIGAYIQENQLLPLLFPDRWNESTKSWKASSAGPPTLGDGVRKFQEVCSVIDDRRADVIRITLRWPNRALAASWINGIVDKADNDLRQQSLREAERSIEYLKNELARTTVLPLQEAIARLLEEQVKTMMYTRARDRFALRVIDAATVPGPRETVPPGRLAMLLIGTLLGAVLAAAACLALARRVVRADTTAG
jgi:uncharacterized protein involved in exopolysaccharide biosynthesis